MRSLLGVVSRLTLVPQGAVLVVAGFLPIFAIVSMFPALPSIMTATVAFGPCRSIRSAHIGLPG